MKPNIKNALLVAALTLLLAGCGAGSGNALAGDTAQADAPNDASPHTGNFVGEVEGTDAFLAVVVDKENHALAYVCDGKKVAEWFRGDVADDGTLDLTSKGGAHLAARVTRKGAEGKLTLSGEEHAFSLELAEGGEAGLYRAQETVDGDEYVGGWIVLESGEERGAVKNRSSGFIGETVGLARPEQPVNGFINNNVGF